MHIERFEIPGLAQYSYIISSDDKAAVVDPIRDIDRYINYASTHALTITHILETHIHADFASGSLALAQSTGAELTLSAHDHGEHYQYSMPHRSLADGESIHIGTVRIEALHTPGHTPEHLAFLVFDTSRSNTVPLALLSGDFLFAGSLGRPDLLGEDATLGLAHELYRSLHQRIASLPDSVQVLPGHGAGSFCGAGMSDLAESTLGYERATNPLFRLNQASFVDEILRSVPPMPSYYPRMKALNASGAPALPTIPGDRALTVLQVQQLAEQNDVILLDTRRAEAFGGAHIPGSINIGAGQNLSLWAGWLLDPGKRIVLIAETGDEEASRRSLVRVGLDTIAGFLGNGIAAWLDAGRNTARTPQLSPEEVAARTPDTRILDVRNDTEWQSGHIEGAHHIALGDLPSSLPSLQHHARWIAVCGSGYRSSIAASLLAQHGIPNVSSMSGGMAAWERLQLPLVQT